MHRYALLVVATLLFATAPQAGLACSCAQREKPQLAEAASVVFTGTVTGVSGTFPISLSCSRSSLDPVFVTFEVETVYKGDVTKSATVMTSEGGATCGYTFASGKRYTVFASPENGRLQTGLCRGTADGTITPNEYGLAPGREPSR